MSNLKKHCPCPVVLIEGNPCKTDVDIDPAGIKGALISVETIWYVPVVFTCSKEDSVETLVMMGRQDETYKDVVPLRGGYRPKRLKSKQLFILQGLTKVGPTVAKRLLEHFHSVRQIMNASVEELIAVEGIEMVSAKAIREVLDSEY